MSVADPREYECVACGHRETVADAFVSTCRRCGGEMRNVDPIRE